MATTAFRSSISAISKAKPCVVTTSAAHGYQTDQLVKITDLGNSMPTARGMENLNDGLYKIVVQSTTQFALRDPLTNDEIDSTDFTAYVSDGNANMITRVIALNNPQVLPYDDADNQYVSNPVLYESDS